LKLRILMQINIIGFLSPKLKSAITVCQLRIGILKYRISWQQQAIENKAHFYPQAKAIDEVFVEVKKNLAYRSCMWPRIKSF
jgi:hypothetical protein